MLFNRVRTINVEEYTHGSVTTNHAPLASTGIHSDFQFNEWRLAQGVAMTLCSKHITKPEYWFDHLSSLLTLSNLIHSHQPNVRIKSSRISSLRDFSRTNKIGEISQGLVYTYMQSTGFPYVNDFHFFCDANHIVVPARASTPDFVCQDRKQTNQICLVESKGKETISTGGIKTKLAKALKQCKRGQTIINASGIYNVIKYLGFCAEWSDENNLSDSIFHFVDPEKEIRQQDTNSAPMRFHYASWFYMVGDFENANRLVNGEKITSIERDFKQVSINKKKYWTLKNVPYSLLQYQNSDLTIHLIENLYQFDIFNGIVGISVKIIESLLNQTYEEIAYIDFKNESTEEYELFVDGTIIIKRAYE
jgi:hypothetical protein